MSGSGAGIGTTRVSMNDESQQIAIPLIVKSPGCVVNEAEVGSVLPNCAAVHIGVDECPVPVVVVWDFDASVTLS